MRDISQAKNHKPSYFLLIVCGLAAGFVNGFLGSGGGIILIFAFALMYPAEDVKDCFVSSVMSILPMSAVSLYFYIKNGKVDFGGNSPLIFILPAVAGGISGAFLMRRISPKTLKIVFAVLMLWAGIRMIR